MRRAVLAGTGMLVLIVCSLRADSEPAAPPYRVEFDPERGVEGFGEHQGRKSWFITVRFAVTRQGDPKPGDVYKIIVEEEGKKRLELEPPKAVTRASDLAVVLAVDTSGSMKEFGRLV